MKQASTFMSHSNMKNRIDSQVEKSVFHLRRPHIEIRPRAALSPRAPKTFRSFLKLAGIDAKRLLQLGEGVHGIDSISTDTHGL